MRKPSLWIFFPEIPPEFLLDQGIMSPADLEATDATQEGTPPETPQVENEPFPTPSPSPSPQVGLSSAVGPLTISYTSFLNHCVRMRLLGVLLGGHPKVALSNFEKVSVLMEEIHLSLSLPNQSSWLHSR